VERLSGLDASFVYNETSALHMHTLKYVVLDVSGVEGGFTVDKLRHELERRLHLLPPFRRRLVEVPLGLHHPVWIEDPDFDLDAHVRRVGVPGPGGRREMDDLVAEIASWQLDRRRPLWECWILEGLADDLDDPAASPPSGRRVGFLVKMHHALADGVAAAALLANVFETDAHALDPPPPIHAWRPEPMPSAWRLALDALRDARPNLRLVRSLVGRTFTGLRAVSRDRRESEVTPPRPIMDTPRTPFNGALTPHRRFATADLRFDDIRAVRAAHPGITVNDVVLGLVAESLRRHLSALDRLPDKALVAGVPVSSDAAGDVRLYGNKVSNLFTSLRTDLPDPVERLSAIHDVTAAAKRFHTLLGTDMLEDWSELFPPKPYAWFMRQYSRLALANRHNPPINLVVSNVPGPRDPLYIAGAELDTFYSVGPVVEGVGLNITVWSYQDAVHVAAIGCREHWEDLHVVTDGMVAALGELVERSRGDAIESQAGA
jgi:diacylglycerol O-acyltransferase / wax synthase